MSPQYIHIMSIRTTSPTCARIGVTVTFRTTRSTCAPPSPNDTSSILDPAGRSRTRRRKNAEKRTDFFRIPPAKVTPSLSLPLLDDSDRKRIRSANRVRTRKRFFCRGPVRALPPHPRRVLPPAGFRLTEQAVILYI